jgi:DNA-binding Lrp family transcriptional regulator
MQPNEKAPGSGKIGWTLLSNHGHVLVCLMRSPDMRLRDVAQMVGITERAVQKIVSELEQGGFIEKDKVGRCNAYRFNRSAPMRHPLECNRNIGEFLDLMV